MKIIKWKIKHIVPKKDTQKVLAVQSIYKKVRLTKLILSQLSTASSMLFFSLAGLMSYLANEGYGISMALTGLILTFTRVFDGVIDPFFALFIDRINTRFGKIRILLLVGWSLRSIAVYLLFVWGSYQSYGIVYFIFIYILFIIGSSLADISGNMIAPIITNDPSQRPYVQVWSTLFSYLVPIAFSLITTLVILPKYGNYYSMQMLSETALLSIPTSFIITLGCVISISDIDRSENFSNLEMGKEIGLVNITDIKKLFLSNRPFQMYLLSSVMTKLSQHISSQAILTTMLFGILIGNLQLGTILNSLSLMPALVFGFIGAKYASKFGNKATTVTWTKLNMVVSISNILFLTTINMQDIPNNKLIMIIFFLALLLSNGTKMCVTIANGAMRSDIIDFEYVLSGKFIPAVITSSYNFIDQLISSFGTGITAFSVSFIGYKTTIPQPTDNATMEIKAITLFLLFGIPILAGAIGLVAMRFYDLTATKMESVQKEIYIFKQTK